MKKAYYLLILLISFFSCNFETPIKFSEEALTETIITSAGNTTSLKNVLKDYKGKVVLIDVWASWCRDCIIGFPKVKALQEAFKDKDLEFVFLSVDRNIPAWKRGIEKYNIQGNHYFVNSGQNGSLSGFLNSNWIPRYMVINKQGNIELFKATNASDKKIIESINNSI